MQNKFLSALAFLGVAAAAFVAGMIFERNLPDLLGTNIPAPISPANGAVLKNDGDVELSWSTVPNAEKYHVVVSHANSANYPAISQAMDVPRLKFSPNIFEVDDGWTWRVKAQVNGKWSKWSEVRTFAIEPRQ